MDFEKDVYKLAMAKLAHISKRADDGTDAMKKMDETRRVITQKIPAVAAMDPGGLTGEVAQGLGETLFGHNGPDVPQNPLTRILGDAFNMGMPKKNLSPEGRTAIDSYVEEQERPVRESHRGLGDLARSFVDSAGRQMGGMGGRSLGALLEAGTRSEPTDLGAAIRGIEGTKRGIEEADLGTMLQNLSGAAGGVNIPDPYGAGRNHEFATEILAEGGRPGMSSGIQYGDPYTAHRWVGEESPRNFSRSGVMSDYEKNREPDYASSEELSRAGFGNGSGVPDEKVQAIISQLGFDPRMEWGPNANLYESIGNQVNQKLQSLVPGAREKFMKDQVSGELEAKYPKAEPKPKKEKSSPKSEEK